MPKSRNSRNPDSGTRTVPPAGKRFLSRRILLLGTAALVPAVAIAFWRNTATAGVKATLYKNPQCDCCEGHASHLDRNGFDVTVIPTNDLVPINRQHGVPESLDGCHTTLTSGYVVIGHVPAAVVQRLLAEKPDVTGISIPGMPSGVPGMEGPKEGPLKVYAFGKGGQTVFATI